MINLIVAATKSGGQRLVIGPHKCRGNGMEPYTTNLWVLMVLGRKASGGDQGNRRKRLHSQNDYVKKHPDESDSLDIS